MVKKCLLLIALVMLLMPLAGAGAQSDREGTDYCQLIAAPDCQILVNNEAVMAEVSSFAFNINMSYYLLPESEAGESHVLLTGDGRVAVAAEALDAAKEMDAAILADSDAMAAALDSLLAGIEGEVSLLLTQTTTDKTGAERVSEMPINMVMKNGIYVLDLTSLGEASAEGMAGMEGEGWLGMNLTGAAQFILADPALAPMMGMESETMDMDYRDLLEEFMTITRLPDESLDGVAVAVFETAMDSSLLLDIMHMSMMAGADTGMEPADLEAAMESLDATILVREYIGLKDFYSHRINVFMDIATADAPAAESLFMSLTVGFDLSDFNAPVNVEVPADAVVLPYAMLMQMQQMRASN